MSNDPVIAIIGAGAAGLMAAIHAAGVNRNVLLLERTPQGGKKILISGGGRCNVLPGSLSDSRFVTASSRHSLQKILRSWPLDEMREFFEGEARLPLVLEAETGKLFPAAGKSRSVHEALRRLADQRGVVFRGNSEVNDITRRTDGAWSLELTAGESLRVDSLILATGGLSVPNTGSDGFAFRVLARLGHGINPTYPALTPLVLSPAVYADLAGISLEATLTAQSESEKLQTRGGFLFTHRGYSGPVLLDLSHVAVRGRLAGEPKAQITVAWGGLDADFWRNAFKPSTSRVTKVVREELPTRLADRLLEEAGISPELTLSQLGKADRNRLIKLLTEFPLPWHSDEGYKKAEVTGGGIPLGEVQPLTLESRILPGVFLAGELLDAFGPIGGYNFTWAWVTGRLAGLGAKDRTARATDRLPKPPS